MSDTPEARRWAQIESIFDRAVELEGPQRDSYLSESCADDVELREEVEGLLRAAESPGPMDYAMAKLAGAVAEEATTEVVGESYAAGRRVGPWKVLEPIGSGGMGRVFLAERVEGGFDQRAALKILRWEVANPQLIERFRNEQQILARLEHPSIARLIDGGLTEEGLPYLAMEYVEGQPIDEACQDRGFDLQQRLQILLQVAEVVDFAHRNLVVHRDLKPSNILLDRAGRVRLLDFGVARIVDETVSNAALTQTHLAPVTPACAAPEQLTGGVITTATDVWALGVLLYQLLSGEHPFELEGQTHEITRRILEETPTPPSRRVPKEKARVLRGDLDNIVARALAKDPERRYGSVDRLIDDIERYQTGQPVSAHAPSWRYRARKAIGRHRRAVTTAVAAVIVVAGLTTYYTWRLAGERDRALAEQAKTEQVKQFVESLFYTNDPIESKGEEITARGMLDRGAARIEDELAGQPEIAAEMHQVVGELYLALGNYPEAHEHFARTVELQRQRPGPDSPELARALTRLANVMREEDDLDAAIAAMRESLGIRRRHPEDRQGLASTLNELGLTLAYQGNYDEAETLLQESADLYEQEVGELNGLTAGSLANLGLAIKWNGDLDRAEPYYRRALEIRKVDPGELSPEYAISLDNLGVLLGQRGDYGESESLFRESLRIRRQILGPDHPDVAMNLNNLATLFRVQGRLDEAEPIYREVLDFNRRIHGSKHRTVATNLHNLGSVLVARADYRGAEAAYSEALAIRREILGPRHIEVAMTENNLVGVLSHLGMLARADSLSRDAVAIARESVGGDSFQLASILAHRGQVLLDRDQPGAARPILEEALQIQHKVLEPGHWEAGESMALLGECLAKQGEAGADSLLTQGHAILSAARGADFAPTRRARAVLFDYFSSRGQPDRAREFAAESEER